MQSSYSNRFFEALQKQREEKSDCDVTIKCEEDEYPAHKFVLSTASPYFDKLFTVDMKDKNKEVVEVTSVSSDTFKVCMAHMYNQQIKLTIDNVDDVLAAASFFQLWNLRNKCFEFKKRLINIDNCLEFYQLTETYNVPKFGQIAIMYIAKNFLKFIENHNDWIISDANVVFLKLLFSSNGLRVKNEEVLWDILLKWVAHDEENRREEFCNMFKQIRLSLISESNTLLDISFNELITTCKECTELVKAELRQRVEKCKNRQERISNKVLIINERFTRLGFLNLANGEEEYSRSIEPPDDCNYYDACSNSVLFQSKLYVFGRSNLYSYDYITDSQWKCLSKIPEGHKVNEEKVTFSNGICIRRPGVILNGELIYLVSGSRNGCKIDIFDISTSAWVHTYNISDIQVTNFCLLVKRNRLFIIGGLDFDTKASALIYEIDMELGTVCKEYQLRQARFDATVSSIEDDTYILKGWLVEVDKTNKRKAVYDASKKNVKELLQLVKTDSNENHEADDYEIALSETSSSSYCHPASRPTLQNAVQYETYSTGFSFGGSVPQPIQQLSTMQNPSTFSAIQFSCPDSVGTKDGIYVFGGGRDEHQPLYTKYLTSGTPETSSIKAGSYRKSKVFLL